MAVKTVKTLLRVWLVIRTHLRLGVRDLGARARLHHVHEPLEAKLTGGVFSVSELLQVLGDNPAEVEPVYRPAELVVQPLALHLHQLRDRVVLARRCVTDVRVHCPRARQQVHVRLHVRITHTRVVAYLPTNPVCDVGHLCSCLGAETLQIGQLPHHPVQTGRLPCLQHAHHMLLVVERAARLPEGEDPGAVRVQLCNDRRGQRLHGDLRVALF
eukprot:8712066-Pyramimonas_sp.AAC.2